MSPKSIGDKKRIEGQIIFVGHGSQTQNSDARRAGRHWGQAKGTAVAGSSRTTAPATRSTADAARTACADRNLDVIEGCEEARTLKLVGKDLQQDAFGG